MPATHRRLTDDSTATHRRHLILEWKHFTSTAVDPPVIHCSHRRKLKLVQLFSIVVPATSRNLYGNMTQLGLHILALNETKIDPLYPKELTCIPGYEQVRLERSNHGGGVAIYFKDNIRFKHRRMIFRIMSWKQFTLK